VEFENQREMLKLMLVQAQSTALILSAQRECYERHAAETHPPGAS